ncbi:MAG: Smr/MutS family protein [Deltaproteobacteria bacterium]|nr:Smr/MutS family protein [Deltaproteobacteria bacterium]
MRDSIAIVPRPLPGPQHRKAFRRRPKAATSSPVAHDGKREADVPEHERKAAADLEWPSLLAAVAGHCRGEQAAARLRSRRPAATPERAREQMLLTAEALGALADGQPVPAPAVPPLEDVLGRLARQAGVSGIELRDLGRVLAAARELRPYAEARQAAQPTLARALASDPSLDSLLAELERAIDDDGGIADAASEELRQARQRVRVGRRTMVAEIARLAARHTDVLREPQCVERDGRYGLAVRADAHRRVAGIVLGASASGATIYIEPESLTELGNDLRMAECEVEREEARVLAVLGAEASAQIAAVAVAYEACIAADELGALSSWAERSRAIALVPEPHAEIELRAARHPLLVARGALVVPGDLVLRSGTALVLSGPNAGGKTVALKCLGLCVWMARAGIPVPAAPGSRLGWFAPVLTDVGDAQSIERSLSTFSAQISNIAVILARADAHTLVLLDELAGGTDPEEGSALAAAVLQALVERGAAVVAATHYERLKQLAAHDARFTNASVGFDWERLTPTFKLTPGIPGASSALCVAARYGLPPPLLEQARALLPRATVERERLLAELERERLALREARAATERELTSAATLRQELEEERRTVRQKERQKLAAEAAELTAAVREARARLRALQAELAAGASGPSGAGLRDAARVVDEAARAVALGSPLLQALRDPDGPGAGPPAAAAGMGPGARVFVARLGAVAEVIEPPEGGQVRVRAGAFTLRVPVADLREARRADEPAARSGRQPDRGTSAAAVAACASDGDDFCLRTSANTVDLRGRRVDEALGELDSFVDRCLRAGEPAGFVLHGHGTGALKQAVREHLACSPVVARARPAQQEEGGDAFTVFWVAP